MQTILESLHSDDTALLQQALEKAYSQFMFHLQAAREAVALYESSYKSARRLVIKLRKQSEADQMM